MFKGIKELLRRKVEEIAEKIYWKSYKKKILHSDNFEVTIKEADILEYIIQWTGKMDPIARFASALTTMGITLPIEVIKGTRIPNEIYPYYRVCVKEIKTKKTYWINLKNSGAKINVIELLSDECEIVQKVDRYSFMWKIKQHYINNLCKMTLLYQNRQNSSVDINGFLGKDSQNNYTYRVFDISRKEDGKTDFQLNKEITKKLESILNHYIEYTEEIKVFEIYNQITLLFLNFYDMEQATVRIECLGKLATFKKGNLTHYEDSSIKLVPYDNWSHKEYRSYDMQVIIDEDTYKVSYVKPEYIQDFIKEAEDAIDKIERLDF